MPTGTRTGRGQIRPMDTARAKVSIIVPVYNAERYLQECLDSCVHQTLAEIEIILIDDCSTDASGGICDRYAVHDARIRVFHNSKNIGEGASRNKGIETATGEYLGFVDADDYLDNDFYEKLYGAAKAADADIAKGGFMKMYPGGALEKQEKMNAKIRFGLKQGLPLFGLFTCEHTTAVYRRDSVVANGHIRYPDLQIAPDDVFLLKVTYFMRSIAMVPDAYYYYRQHTESVSALKDSSYYDSILRSVEHCISFLNESPMPREEYNRLFLKISNRAIAACRAMQHDDVSADYRQTFLRDLLGLLQMYAMIDITKAEKILAALTEKSAAASSARRRGPVPDIAVMLRRLFARIFMK